MRIRFGQPIISEGNRHAVAQSLLNRNLTNAGAVLDFEEKFCEFLGGGKALAVSNCTAALYLALKAQDIGQGDEVILPAQTFVACAHAIEMTGAKPIFVDVWPDTGTMDPALYEAAITEKTKAVMPVHFVGRPCFMGTIIDISRRHGIKIVEDCATALGARHSNRHVGLLGDAGAFSFHPVKHITTGEGGMVVSTNMDLIARMKRMREFGKVSPEYGGSWEMYDVVDFGFNFRMTEMQATLGIGQLTQIERRLEIRERNWEALALGLQGFTILDTRGAYYALILILPDGLSQPDIRQKLAAEHVETSVYYPGPLPFFTYYRKKYNYREGMWPNAERIAKRSIAFSVGPHLNLERMQATAERFRKVIAQCG